VKITTHQNQFKSFPLATLLAQVPWVLSQPFQLHYCCS
jgi:hypothetical protein